MFDQDGFFNPSAAEIEWPDLTLSGDEVLMRNLSMYVSTSDESIMWLHWNLCVCACLVD